MIANSLNEAARGVSGPSLKLHVLILVLSFRHSSDQWDKCVRAYVVSPPGLAIMIEACRVLFGVPSARKRQSV